MGYVYFALCIDQIKRTPLISLPKLYPSEKQYTPFDSFVKQFLNFSKNAQAGKDQASMKLENCSPGAAVIATKSLSGMPFRNAPQNACSL